MYIIMIYAKYLIIYNNSIDLGKITAEILALFTQNWTITLPKSCFIHKKSTY